MPASIVQSANGTLAGAGQLSANLPNCVAGNRIILAIAGWAADGGTAVPEVVYSLPARSWEEDARGLFAQVGSSTQGQQVTVWSAAVPANDSYALFAQFGSDFYGRIVAMEVSGLVASPLDRTATAGANNASDLTPSVGPTAALSQANEFVLAVLGATSGITTTDISADAVPGYTRVFYNGDAYTLCAIAVESKTVSSTAAVSAAWGTVAAHTEAWSGALVTYRDTSVTLPADPPLIVAAVTLSATASLIVGAITLGTENPPPPVALQRTGIIRRVRAVTIANGLLRAAPANIEAAGESSLEPLYAGAREVFYDDFPGTTLDRNKWRIIYGGEATGYGANFIWDNNALEVNDGLTIRTRYENGRWYSGGMSQGYSNFNFPGYLYGQISIRARVDAGQGYGPALLMWPVANQGEWTNELDILEAPSPSKQSGFNVVHGNPPDTIQDGAEFSADLTQWHTYTMRWEADRIIFYLDGVVLREVTSITVNQAMSIGLQGFVSGVGHEWYGGPPNDFADKLIQVEYVRVVQIPAGGGGSGDPPPPPPPPPAGTRHITITSAHANVLVDQQYYSSANVRLVLPIYPFTHVLDVQVQNTSATPSKQPYWGSNPFGYLATQNGGELAINREMSSLDYGTYKTEIYQELNDGTFLTVDVFLTISNSATGPAPAPVAPPNPPAPFFEDFLPRTGTGALFSSFGNIRNTGTGTVQIDGVGSANQPFDNRHGFPNGLFEFRSRYIGPNIGDGTGPCQLLWPADDLWPGTEIDLGELMPDGTFYLAIHWAINGIPGSGGTANNADALWAPKDNPTISPDGTFDHQAWHTYGALLLTDRIKLYVDGLLLADYTDHPAPDAANGGVDHSFGILCNSTNRGLEVDWCRWTPEALVPQPGSGFDVLREDGGATLREDNSKLLREV